MKNYMALSFNTKTNQSEEVYVMANNLKEAKSKVANCIMICKLTKSNNSKMYF
jgi:recombinational DNA repair protein RecR